MSSFVYPWEYNFPPFFTIQPNQDTRRAQLSKWRSLVLNYCMANKIYSMETKTASNHPLFYNKAIGRQLTSEGLSVVLEDLREHGNLEWGDKGKAQFYVHWKTVGEWAQILHHHASESGLLNTVCTFYELVGDDAQGKEFYGLDENVLKKALQHLEGQGKAALISFDGNEGVKFL